MSYLYYIIRISYSTEQGVSIDATTMIKSCNVVVEKNDLCNIQGELFYTRHYIHMYKTYIHCIHMYKTYTGRNKG